MASGTKNVTTDVVEVVVQKEVERVTGITLHLTLEEAHTLRRVLSRIGGGGMRHFTGSIVNTLYELGINDFWDYETAHEVMEGEMVFYESSGNILREKVKQKYDQ